MIATCFALFAWAGAIISFINLRRTNRSFEKVKWSVDLAGVACRRRITVVTSDGTRWTRTLAQICEGPQREWLTAGPGGRIEISTDYDPKDTHER